MQFSVHSDFAVARLVDVTRAWLLVHEADHASFGVRVWVEFRPWIESAFAPPQSLGHNCLVIFNASPSVLVSGLRAVADRLAGEEPGVGILLRIGVSLPLLILILEGDKGFALTIGFKRVTLGVVKLVQGFKAITDFTFPIALFTV